MAENFSEFQKNVCEPPEREPLKRICPACKPNPNYIVPNWTQMVAEPFYNEKTCEFMVCVTLNKFGDSYVVSPTNMFPSGETAESRTQKRKLLRSYVEAGIRLMLEEYGKLIADQIICAYHTGPALDMLPAEIITTYEDYEDAYAALALDPVMAAEDRVNACRDIDLPTSPFLNPEDPSEFTQNLIGASAKLPQIKNPLALEIYAYPKEWTLVEGEGGLLKVLIAIPSFILEKVPDNPTRDKIEKEAVNLKSEVVLTTDKLWAQIQRLKSAMWVYSQYQSAFLQVQKGYLYVPIEESKISFYASTYSERIGTLYTTLKDVGLDNGWNIRSNIPSVIKNNARLVKITFDNSDTDKPYKVLKIESKKKGCPYEEWTQGMSKLSGSPSPFDATVWNYIAKLNEIDVSLRSRKSYPWMDFLIKFTYPLLSVDYGRFSEKSLEEEGLQCVSENIKNHAVELRDYILNESLSVSDFIQYEFNKNSCTDFGDLDQEHEVKIPESERKKKKDSVKQAKKEARDIAIEEARVEKERLWKKVRALESEIIILQQKIDRFNSLKSVYDPDFQQKWTSPTELAGWMKGIQENQEKIKEIQKKIKKTDRQTNNKERQYSRAASKYVRQQHNKSKKPKEDPYWRIGYEAALEEFAQQDTLLESIVDKATYLKKGGLNFKNMKELDLVKLIKRMSVCNLKTLTIQSVRCLFSGVTVDDALTKIVKASLEAMDLDVFGIFINNLPPQKQIELRKAFEQEFGNLPLPWEQDYDPGSIENTNLYIQYLKELPPEVPKPEIEETPEEPDMELPGYTGISEEEIVATPPAPDPIKRPTEQHLKDADKSWKAYIQRRKNKGYSSGTPVKEAWYEFITLYWDARVTTQAFKDFKGVYDFHMDFPRDDNLLHYDNYVKWYNNTQAYLVENASRTKLMRRDKTVEEIKKLIPLTQAALEEWDKAVIEEERKKQREVMAAAAQAAQEEAAAKAEAYRREQEQMMADTQALIDARYEQQEQSGYELSPGAMAIRDWGRKQQAKAGNSYIGRSASATRKSLSEEWSKLTDKERRQITKNELGKDSPGGQQGTYGVALGNIQKLVVDAYIEFLLDIVEIDELMQILDRFPGSDILYKFVGDYTCAYQGMFKPPIDSFLSTFTLDVCGDGGIGIGFPDQIKEIPGFFDKSALLVLKKQFAGKIEGLLTEVIKRLILKVLEGIDSALCKGLNAVGMAAADLASGKTAGLDSIFAEAFCPDASEDELNNTKKNIFKASGIVGSGITDQSYNDLYKSMNSTMSKNDLVGLLTNTPKNMNAKVLTDLSQLVATVHPELADVFGTPSQVAEVFGQAGNYIPPELRQALRDQALTDEETPLYDAVCLTQPELDAWNEERANIYENLGVDPATARDLVDQANGKRDEDIGDLLDYLEKGTDGILGDAVDSLLDPSRDPGCVNDKSALLFEDESLRQTKLEMIKSMFENIDRSFLGELIGRRNAVLNNILRDKNNFRLKKHERRADSPFFFPNYTNSPADWEFRKENSNILISGRMEPIPVFNPEPKPLGNYPKTVGSLMKTQMESYTSYLSNRSTTPQAQVSKQFINSFESVPSYEFQLNFKLRKVAKPSYQLEVVETFRNKITEAEAERLGLDYGLFSKKSLPPMVSLDLEVNNDFKATKYLNFNYVDNQEELPYQALIFKSLLESKISGTIEQNPAVLMKAFDRGNKTVLQCVQNAVIQTPSGDIPTGFRFGYEGGEPLTFADLWYVNPDASPDDKSSWVYTHLPGDRVLGKSATENPRVHFLDPSIHGGNYLFPKIYVEPASYNGWLGMIRTFIPELKSCEKEDNGFLNITQIAKRAKEVEDNLPFDERLSLAPDCRIEVPYDKHFSSATHGIMEGVVLSTMRVYCSEYIFKTLPVYSGIELSSKNVDNAFLNLIIQQMKNGLTAQTTSWNMVQGYTYYLMFLEQAVQVVQRQIQDGLMEETQEIKNAFTIIETTQINYDPIKINIFDWENMPWDSISDTFRGAAIIAFGEDWQQDYDNVLTEELLKSLALLAVGGPAAITAAQAHLVGTLLTRCAFLSPFKLRLARKINSLHESRAAAEVILRALAKNELSLLMKKINLNMRPRPHIEDIQKYLLSRNGILFGSSLRSGEMKIEQPAVEGSTGFDYGDIFNVVRDVEVDNPFNNQEITVTAANLAIPAEHDDALAYFSEGLLETPPAAIPEFLKRKVSNMITLFQNGLFYLEKYVRVYTKDGEERVLSIPEFQELIASKLQAYEPGVAITQSEDLSLETLVLDPSKNISEFFGNAYIVEDEVMGTIGVKFGVRLIYSPPPQFNYTAPEDNQKERTYTIGVPEVSLKVDESVHAWLETLLGNTALKERIIESLDGITVQQESLSRAIPVVEFEQDIKDRPVGDLDLEGKNMGEELKCYIDNLTKEEDFKVLFDTCFPARSFVSFYGVYSFYGFFESIGMDLSNPDEVDEDPGKLREQWKKALFDKTKKKLRQLFNATYRTDDDEKEENEPRSKREKSEFLKNLLPQAFMNLDSSVQWWQRIRFVDIKPFDADGQDCLNSFQKMFR